MKSQYAKLPLITIANGAQNSRIIQGEMEDHDAVGIMLYSPATLPETVNIQVNPEPNQTDQADAGWRDYQTFDVNGNPALLYVPVQNQARVYQEVLFAGSWRLHSGSAVGADRSFLVGKVYTT